MSKYAIGFESGELFPVKFLDDVAPNTVKAFKEALPLHGECLQARFAGEEFFFNADIDVEKENIVQPYHGAIAFNSDPEWKAVCIYYGSTIEMGEDEPFNLFAEVTGDLDKLKEVGERIWKEGKEKIAFLKVPEK